MRGAAAAGTWILDFAPSSCHQWWQIQPHTFALQPSPKGIILERKPAGSRQAVLCPWVPRVPSIPDQTLLLSATSTPCTNNPTSPFSLTFMAQPCQTSSVQIQPYHSHTSVPDWHPWGFWASIPADHSSTGFGLSASGWCARRLFMEKGGGSWERFDKGVCTFSDVLIQTSKVWVEVER